MQNVIANISRRRRLLISVQVAFLIVLFGLLAWVFRDAWADAGPRLREANPVDLALAGGFLGAYYLLFVIGWQWILRALRINASYPVVLQAEMASMLAKYVPGGIWTPAARVVWLRKVGGVGTTSVVVASILLEAGLSAVAGVLVLLCSLPWIDGVDIPLLPLVAFGVGVAALLHPRVFPAVAGRLFRPFGADEPPALPWRTMLGLLVFYSGTWIVGGVALLFLLRAVGGEAGLDDVAFLGGAAAVGAIVAVLSIIAPSGLGVREASMYGLLLAVASPGVALGAIVLNRLAITVVEAALFGAGVLIWRAGRHREAPEARPVPNL